jgi:galactonate dehydratase
MEIGGAAPRAAPHVPEGLTFRNGRLWPNDRPGLGVVFDPTETDLVLDVTERCAPIPRFERPDGSFTNW